MERLGKLGLRTTVAAGLAAALALGGCSGQKLEGSDKGGTASTMTLKVNFWGDMGLDKLKTQYEAAHPNVKIVLNSGEYNAQHEDLQNKLVPGSGRPAILNPQYEAAHPTVRPALNPAEYNAKHEDLQKKLAAGSGAPDISAVEE